MYDFVSVFENQKRQLNEAFIEIMNKEKKQKEDYMAPITISQNSDSNEAVEKIKSILKSNPNISLYGVEIDGEKISDDELNVYSNHDKKENRIKPFQNKELESIMEAISKEIIKASKNRSVIWKYY